jgi:hypothetical protein
MSTSCTNPLMGARCEREEVESELERDDTDEDEEVELTEVVQASGHGRCDWQRKPCVSCELARRLSDHAR